MFSFTSQDQRQQKVVCVPGYSGGRRLARGLSTNNIWGADMGTDLLYYIILKVYITQVYKFTVHGVRSSLFNCCLFTRIGPLGLLILKDVLVCVCLYLSQSVVWTMEGHWSWLELRDLLGIPGFEAGDLCITLHCTVLLHWTVVYCCTVL